MESYFDDVARGWDSCPEKVQRAFVTAQKITEVSLSSSDSLIDFGSGTGLLGVQLRDIFDKVLLVDTSEKMLEQAQAKISKSDITNVKVQLAASLSEIKGKYSTIATLMTLHHVDNVQGFFHDAFECLNSDGYLIVADLYAEDGSFHKHNPNFDGHNGFNISKLTEMAQCAGFSIESCEQYFEILQKNYSEELVAYPLFFFVAKKTA